MTASPGSAGSAGREGPTGSAPSPYNLPNALTLLRILLVPVIAVLVLVDDGQSPLFRTLGFVVFAAAAITDKIDGDLARSRGLVTDFGKIADPIADKLLLGTILVIFSHLGQIPWWITVVILGRELGVTLLRFWVIRYGVIAASPGGKLKTLLQVVALGLYVLPLELWLSGTPETLAEGFVLVVLLAALVVTVVTGLDYVVRAVRLRRGAGA